MKTILKAEAKRNRKKVSIPNGSTIVNPTIYNDGGKVRISIRIDSQYLEIWLDPMNEDLLEAIQLANIQTERDLKTLRKKELAFDEKIERNMMSRKPYIEKVDANFTSTPASETYWSS